MRIVTLLVLVNAMCWAQDSGSLNGIATLRPGVTSERASSWDRRGGNADFVVVKSGSTIPLAEIRGPGEIRHMWFMIASPTPNHLREVVLRMYWDSEADPSVEVPIGDFFGTGFQYEDIPGVHVSQAYNSWQSLPLTVNGNEPHQKVDPPPLKERFLQPFWRIQTISQNLPKLVTRSRS